MAGAVRRSPTLRFTLLVLCLAFPAFAAPWPNPIPPPPGLEKSPGPWNDPKDLTAWPNTTCRANGDPWIAENHDKLRIMRPRLLLINYSNEHPRDQLDKQTNQLIKALAESTRYHGYKDPKAPAFLQYEVFKFVDLRDADRKTGNSRTLPVKDPDRKRGFNMKYRAYFSDEFAKHYGVPDPRDAKRFLRLDELLDGGLRPRGLVLRVGNTNAVPHSGAFEVVEEKPVYDEQFRKVGDKWVQAGNGGDADQPWTGRSVRIGCVNASRGIGCFLESLAHGMEYCAKADAIPYFSRYFKEYAGFDLKARFKLPVNDLYEVDYAGEQIRFPDEKTMVFKHRGKELRADNYIVAGGNAHFPRMPAGTTI